jgi:hypothetical protein
MLFWLREHHSDALHSAHPRPTFCEHREREREWESRPPKLPSAELHLHECASDQVFGDRTRSVRLTNVDPVLRHRRCSRDYTVYICLHQLRTTTLNIHTRCLMWMEPLMPWAVPPRGTLCYSYLCMFYCCLLLMAYASSDTHIHIHVITCITLIFGLN